MQGQQDNGRRTAAEPDAWMCFYDHRGKLLQYWRAPDGFADHVLETIRNLQIEYKLKDRQIQVSCRVGEPKEAGK